MIGPSCNLPLAFRFAALLFIRHRSQVHSYDELKPLDSDWPVGRHRFGDDVFKPKASERSIPEINTCAGVKQNAEWVTFTPETRIRQALA